MEFWIEGTIEQVIRVANDGLADAIATNPAIIERWTAGGRTLEQVVAEVCGRVNVPVYVQLHGPTMDDFLREMDSLRRISRLIQPKLVATPAGFAATRRLAAEEVQPLVTTISTLSQAYMAACANASYVAPYIGRILDAQVDGYALVAEISAMFERHHVRTQIAAASIRSPEQAECVLQAGAPVLVMQYEVFQKLAESSLTNAWIEDFETKWDKIPHSLSPKA